MQKNEFAAALYYCDVPKYFMYINNQWKLWVRDASDTLSRVYSVHPKHAECYYLRMLLFDVKGPKSFEDLRKVDGKICFTYQEACKERGLLEDDAHWEATLKEDIVFKSPVALRNMFSLLI